MKICHACKRELVLSKSAGRRDECPFCSVDLRCCLNCAFYDSSASKQCREPAADLVRQKDKANFCDYFVFAESRGAGAPAASAEQTRKAIDELFNK
jgi:hypothetical protein